ncbi:MAG TPA: DNA-binding protein [Planctomycetaceae bacterium]|nr:DNA-binding protein [Planctomycetaceae bacterium]
MRQLATSDIPFVLDKCDLADILKVSARTIERWIRKGLFPPGRRLGGQVRWLRDDLLEALGAFNRPPCSGRAHS